MSDLLKAGNWVLCRGETKFTPLGVARKIKRVSPSKLYPLTMSVEIDVGGRLGIHNLNTFPMSFDNAVNPKCDLIAIFGENPNGNHNVRPLWIRT